MVKKKVKLDQAASRPYQVATPFRPFKSDSFTFFHIPIKLKYILRNIYQ